MVRDALACHWCDDQLHPIGPHTDATYCPHCDRPHPPVRCARCLIAHARMKEIVNDTAP